MVQALINGIKVDVEEGTTILEAAERHGIFIPSLCSHPLLPEVRAGEKIRPTDFIYQGKHKITNDETAEVGWKCGLCLVQIGAGGNLVRACETPIEDGMVVVTETDVIQMMRRKAFENILKTYRHPSVCITCDRETRCPPFGICSRSARVTLRCVACPGYQNCELLEIADYVGFQEASLPSEQVESLLVEDNPLFEFDPALCVGCLRCVRYCQFVKGVGALRFVMREGRIRVGTALETFKQSGCNFCMECTEICPTAALIKKKEKWVSTGKKATTMGVSV